ncbi:DUF2863 family protein [Piscinibacterium candidicorallinum]|uniref:DUF2863 family protein n=1 Tax=Piscinibacterium candidicorallinum TaxID=1793872 RepID=A0ABV7H128_9BURK
MSMRPNRTTSRLPRSSNAETLIKLAQSLAQAGSRLEDEFWFARLTAEIERQLVHGSDNAIHASLEFLFGSEDPAQIGAYEALADAVETSTESMQVTIDGQPHDVLLIVCPLMAWSRAQIASGKVARPTLEAVRNQLAAHILAHGVRLTLVEALFSPDQMPEGYVSIYRLLKKCAQALMNGEEAVKRPDDWPEAQGFLADSRFLIGAIAAPAGTALFNWQAEAKRADCIEHWKRQGGAALAGMLSNCAYEMVAPGAFFDSTRGAEREIRGFSVRASVSFLHMTLDLAPPAQTAAVARVSDRDFEEYRIGFMNGKETEVLHGCIWPLLGPEVDSTEVTDDIDATLREAGITNIVHIDTVLPAEYCADCGAPMYPNQDGELLHAELPDADSDEHGPPRHLH